MTPAPGTPIRVCLYGLGAIGSAVARAILATRGLAIVAAIDTDKAKNGRDLHSLLRLKDASGVVVTDDPRSVLAESAAPPDVVIHCTGSRLADVVPQLETILDAGIPCVTSCEEMAMPEAADPLLADRLDRLARSHGVALLGAGVNPGFVMDALVVALSGATVDVTHISVERVLDPLARRRVFRKKVGLGMQFAEASRLVQSGRLGHIGLKQSAMLVARGMGWELSSITEDIRLLCEDDTPSKRSRRPARPDASIIGMVQTLVASDAGGERLRMEMVMAAGAEAPHDAITISGSPDLSLWIQGGVPGDQATVACLINGMIQVIHAPRPGLLTMLDLPLRPTKAPARGKEQPA